MSQRVENTDVEAARERFHAAVGRAVERVTAETELAISEPVDPERLISLLGRLVILERLCAGVFVPLDLIEFFFGTAQPDPRTSESDPTPEISQENFLAKFRSVVVDLEERTGITTEPEPVAVPAA